MPCLWLYAAPRSKSLARNLGKGKGGGMAGQQGRQQEEEWEESDDEYDFVSEDGDGGVEQVYKARRPGLPTPCCSYVLCGPCARHTLRCPGCGELLSGWRGGSGPDLLTLSSCGSHFDQVLACSGGGFRWLSVCCPPAALFMYLGLPSLSPPPKGCPAPAAPIPHMP